MFLQEGHKSLDQQRGIQPACRRNAGQRLGELLAVDVNVQFTSLLERIDDLDDLTLDKTPSLLNDNNLAYEPKQVCVTSGGKQACFNAILAMCDEGDEVIIPAPYWVTLKTRASLKNGRKHDHSQPNDELGHRNRLRGFG